MFVTQTCFRDEEGLIWVCTVRAYIWIIMAMSLNELFCFFVESVTR